MSKYTTEVRYICESYAGLTESTGYDNIRTVIANSRDKIFDFDYPIFDNDYRETLETKILNHYYTREIGVETVGLWKHFLDVRMNEIMPYYNQLYKSALLEFDPFNDVDYTKEGNKTNQENVTEDNNGTNKMTGTVTDTTNGTETNSGSDVTNEQNVPKNSTWTLYSDTPQGGVAGINSAEPSVGSNAYLTNATHVITDATGSNLESETEYGKIVQNEGQGNREYDTTNEIKNKMVGVTNGRGDYFEKIKGKMSNKSYSELLQELRKTFLNIDLLIINELSDLFFNIY